MKKKAAGRRAAGAGGYTSESYASTNLPDRSIYQSDERIFHRAGFRYDTVARASRVPRRDGALEFRCALSNGGAARLTVEAVDRGIWRVRFGRGRTPPLRPGLMIDPAWRPSPSPLRARAARGAVEAAGDGRTVRVGLDPFALAFGGGGRAGGALPRLELETGRIAGEFPAAPLGFRVDLRTGAAAPYLSWKLRNGERFFGLGEKWNACEKSGTRATVWISETCGSNTTDLSYKPLPLLFSTAGWGLLAHTGFRTAWEVGTWSYVTGSVLSEAPDLDLFLFFADGLPGLLERYTALTGRPGRPPRWALGTWMSRCMYERAAEAEEAMDGLRARGIPADVIHLDPLWMRTHYYWKIGVDACDFARNDAAFPDLPGLWRKWRANGFTTCLWINPYLPEGGAIYDEAARRGFLLRSSRGGLARLSHGNPVGMVDFTNPAARAWWKGHLLRQLRDGAGVLKPDYGDRVPEDAVFHNGWTGREGHNLYLHLYAETCYRALEEVTGRGFVWRRAGYVGTQRYPGGWAGDTQTTWEAMRCCLRGGLSAGISGEAFWASDIGGFVGKQPTPEHFIRWMQLGFLSALTRFHGAGSPREPWRYGETAVAVARRYGRLRYRLIPYLLACAREAARTGMPLMRHLALAYPGLPGTEAVDDQYLLGPDLLVAPILEPGLRERDVFLPPGRWYPWEGGAPIEGGGWRRAAAPLERVPLFARGGGAVPMYAAAPPHLKGPSPRRIVLATFGRPDDRTLVVPDDDYTLRLALRGGRVASRSPANVSVRVVARR